MTEPSPTCQVAAIFRPRNFRGFSLMINSLSVASRPIEFSLEIAVGWPLSLLHTIPPSRKFSRAISATFACSEFMAASNRVANSLWIGKLRMADQFQVRMSPDAPLQYLPARH